MNIVVNGEPRDVAAGTAVNNLIVELELRSDRVAVELNGRIVRREAWADTILEDSDRIEIVHFVGGG